jgi:hypothetical protein
MKVELIPIYKSELKKLIELAFEGDTDLCEKYHISPGTLQHCVDYTYKFISDDLLAPDMNYYEINLRDGNISTQIGYTVTVIAENPPHDLYSYAINMKWRKKEILIQWLDEVEKLLGLPFGTGLHPRNTRAIEFFKKNGFTEIEHKGYKLFLKEQIKELQDAG